MTLHEITTTLTNAITRLGQQFAPDVPTEVLRYGLAALLGALAFTLLLLALRIMRRQTPPAMASDETIIPHTLQKTGVVVDMLKSPSDDVVLVRCVITSAKSNKITCEIIERLDVIKVPEGNEIICIFAPIKTESGKLNSFTAHLLESDKAGRKADRVILSAPTSYSMIPRRKYTRKKVADQQFIRVKMWVSNPHSSDIAYEDAAPQISVNSFTTDTTDQGANAVVNISNGGLGLSVRNKVIPETCAVGAPVAINLFMFNFKKKTFKPYWYSGQVRSMEESRPGFTRMGIEFNGNGRLSNETGQLRWNKF